MCVSTLDTDTASTAPAATSTSGKKKAVVVGAGVGGLNLSGRLARAGYDVVLLEKNEMVSQFIDSLLYSVYPHEFPQNLLCRCSDFPTRWSSGVCSI